MAIFRPMDRLRHPRSPSELLIARLTLVTLAVIAIDLIAAFFFYLLERDASETDVKTYEQSLFWTTSQLTSVSSSLSNPVTTGGHVLAIGIDILAVGVVTVLVATIVQHLHLVSPRREEYFRERGRAAPGSEKTGGGETHSRG
jgi:NhaP-type Na+/H+ or K+/H+ antiporter